MAAAPAIISGVSAVGGLVSSSSQASKQKAAINEQMRAAETQRILNRMELKSQEQSVELNNQRQQQLLGSQQAVALMQNDLENQQSNLQNTQAQIEQDRQQVLNTQRVFQRKAVANQQAAQIFRQTSQQQLQQQNELSKAADQESQRENALAGSNVQQGSVSSEMAAERLALAVQNGQIDLDSLYNTQVQDELRQLGYEYDVADIERRIGQLGLDYQQRDLGRTGELTGIQYNSNKDGIETQSQRNRAAMDYELATSKTALAQASVSNEATSNAQMSALQSQKSMTKGPSMFDWLTTIGGIGLDVYRSNPNNQAKRPTNNRGFTMSDTKTAFPDNLPGGPSYIPASSMEGAPSYMPKQLDYPTEMVFNRPRSSYGYANKAARSVFGRN